VDTALHSPPRRLLMLAALGAIAPALAAEPPLVVLVDGSIEMPQAQIEGYAVVDGLQYHIALELGLRLRRDMRFRLVPRRRVAPLLLAGEEADLICNYHPAWLPGALQWSQPFMESGDLLVSAARVPAPRTLADLAGQTLGTIAGFSYPEVEAVLGAGFPRDDAPNLPASLRKLTAGRVDHIIVGQATFDYLRHRGDVRVAIHPPLALKRRQTACALSPASRLPLPALDAALAAMKADGTVRRILDLYR